MGRVVHFEIHADQPSRAIAFYQELFGWEFLEWAGPFPYWIVKTGPDSQPGINGGLMPRRGALVGEGVGAYICTAAVTDLDQAFAKALSLGAQTAVPKMPIPGVGWLAYIKDPEGNLLGLHQDDPKAA